MSRKREGWMSKMDTAMKYLGGITIGLLAVSEILNLVSEHKRIESLGDDVDEEDLSMWQKSQTYLVLTTCLQIALIAMNSSFMSIILYVVILFLTLFVFVSFILTKMYVDRKD